MALERLQRTGEAFSTFEQSLAAFRREADRGQADYSYEEATALLAFRLDRPLTRS